MMKTMKAYFACLEIDINNVDSHATLYSHIQTNKKEVVTTQTTRS